MPQLLLTRPRPLELVTWALATLALYAALNGRFRVSSLLWVGAIAGLLGARVPVPPVARLRIRVVAVRRRTALWVSTPGGQELVVLDDPAQRSSLESMLRTHGVASAQFVSRGDDRSLELEGSTLRASDGGLRLEAGRLRLGWGDEDANVWLGPHAPPGVALAVSDDDLPLELETDGMRLWWRRWR